MRPMSREMTVSRSTALAVVALVLALCGSAVAGAPAKLSKLIDGTQIKPRSQPANRIVKNGLKGKQIDEASLGIVPKATHALTATSAANAATADTATTASNTATVGGETASELTVKCRTGTTLIAGGCVETGPPRTAAIWENAIFVCHPRSLATVPQLQALQAGGGLSGVEWAVTLVGPANAFTVDMGTGAINGDNITAVTHPFRCVGTPVNY
jgi:ribosomal protein L12E/L44/L45/RPP1/RPP2